MPLYKVEFFNMNSGNKHSEYVDEADDAVSAESGARTRFSEDNFYDSSLFRTGITEVSYEPTAVTVVPNAIASAE